MSPMSPPNNDRLTLAGMEFAMRRVALMIDTSRAYGREVLRGAWRYIQEKGPWSVVYRPMSLNEATPEWLAKWDGDGVMVYVNQQRTVNLLRKSAAGVVDLLGCIPSEFPFVGTDHQRIGEMAAEHLLGRGFVNFAACGLLSRSRPGLAVRLQVFGDQIEQAGHDCHIFRPRGGRGSSLSWEKEQRQIAQWIARLPKPLAIFACNDTRAREILYVCKQASYDIPGEVAVLGVGNDELLCELSDDRLSSIDVDPRRVGYSAAEILDQVMAGKSVQPRTLIAPRYVVSRQSTDILAVNDDTVLTALKFIRRYAADPINVGDVVAEVDVERRVLERRFRELVGRSLKDEITRIRLQTAKELLAETDLTCEQIAYRCGFGSPSYFMDFFRRKVGVTPGAFRGARNLKLE